jgi:hypothetical protein
LDLFIACDSTGQFPVAVNLERSFHFSTISGDGSNVVLVCGTTVAKVTDSNAFQHDVPGLFPGQVLGTSNLFQFGAIRCEKTETILFDDKMSEKLLKVCFYHEAWAKKATTRRRSWSTLDILRTNTEKNVTFSKKNRKI